MEAESTNEQTKAEMSHQSLSNQRNKQNKNKTKSLYQAQKPEPQISKPKQKI